MPHVSKKQLKEKVFLSIYDQFVGVVSAGSGRNQKVLVDLLTKTEKIMFAKRLAAIFMLTEGASLYHIQSTLNMSASTAARFSRNMKKGLYGHIEVFFHTKQKKKDFWEVLEVVISGGMPPIGRGRWKWLYDMDSKYK